MWSFYCQILIPLLATQLHIHLERLMTCTVPSLHDSDGHVIRGEWSLEGYSKHESQEQSHSICLISQSAISVNESVWSVPLRTKRKYNGRNQSGGEGKLVDIQR